MQIATPWACDDPLTVGDRLEGVTIQRQDVVEAPRAVAENVDAGNAPQFAVPIGTQPTAKPDRTFVHCGSHESAGEGQWHALLAPEITANIRNVKHEEK